MSARLRLTAARGISSRPDGGRIEVLVGKAGIGVAGAGDKPHVEGDKSPAGTGIEIDDGGVALAEDGTPPPGKGEPVAGSVLAPLEIQTGTAGTVIGTCWPPAAGSDGVFPSQDGAIADAGAGGCCQAPSPLWFPPRGRKATIKSKTMPPARIPAAMRRWRLRRAEMLPAKLTCPSSPPGSSSFGSRTRTLGRAGDGWAGGAAAAADGCC